MRERPRGGKRADGTDRGGSEIALDDYSVKLNMTSAARLDAARERLSG